MPELWLGIDLGTTNSVLAWGEQTLDDPVRPQVLDVQRQLAGGGMARRAPLPSCVLVRPDGLPVVGDLPLALVGRSPDVISGSKSRIGRTTRYPAAGQAVSPTDVATWILQHLLHEARRQLHVDPDRVVVTVPASFDTDMRRATLEAMERAGIRIRDDEGKPIVTLLDEPRAALYDFLNRQARGEIPRTVLDVRADTHVLVFDLGGGTLDVSLHALSPAKGGTGFEVEDLAVSRYTRLGGDDFDAVLGEAWLAEFAARGAVDPAEHENLRARFRRFACEAKEELTAELDQNRMFGVADDESVTVDVIRGDLPANRTFQTTLTAEGYARAVRTLLAPELRLEDARRLPELDPAPNLVIPILDVLAKAHAALGEWVRVDAVLLNGGMTRVQAVQRRLRDLFGFEPIALGDPDLAVARGAVVFQQWLAQGHQIHTVLNESIGLAVRGGGVRRLIQAGTLLPAASPTFADFSVPPDRQAVRYIDLPLMVGEGRDTRAPNRPLATRRLHFPGPLSQGENISVKLHVDESHDLVLEAWVTRHPEQRFRIAIQAGAEAGTDSSPPTSPPTPPPTVRRNLEPAPPSGPPLSGQDIEDYVAWLALMRPGVFQDDPDMRASVMGIEADALNAANRLSVGHAWMEAFNQQLPQEGLGRLVRIIGRLAEREAELRRPAMALFQRLILPRRWANGREPQASTYARFVLVHLFHATGFTREPEGERLLLDWLEVVAPRLFLVPPLLYGLGRCGHTRTCLEVVAGLVQHQESGIRTAALWAAGRLGSREAEPGMPKEWLESCLHHLIAVAGVETQPSVLRDLVYALAEWVDTRYPDRKLGPTFQVALLKALQKLEGRLGDLLRTNPKHGQLLAARRLLEVAIQMAAGRTLSEDHVQVLLEVRSAVQVAGVK